MKTLKVLTVIIVCFLMLGAQESCTVADNSAPLATSDSPQSFSSSTPAVIPIDPTVYLITGTVVADVGSLTRQIEPSSSSFNSYSGYASGYYRGPEIGGKSFIRLFVKSIEPLSKIVESESIAILKGTDTKLQVLMPGDIVTVKCRVQYEAVAAVMDNEVFDATRLETWEFDYCRMVHPRIKKD